MFSYWRPFEIERESLLVCIIMKVPNDELEKKKMAPSAQYHIMGNRKGFVFFISVKL